MSADNPVSPKALAGAGGAGLGATLGTLVNWILGVTLWHASASASKVGDAIAAVPTPVSGVLLLLVPGLVAASIGWRVTDPLRVTTTQLHQLKAVQGLIPGVDPEKVDVAAVEVAAQAEAVKSPESTGAPLTP